MEWYGIWDTKHKTWVKDGTKIIWGPDEVIQAQYRWHGRGPADHQAEFRARYDIRRFDAFGQPVGIDMGEEEGQ